MRAATCHPERQNAAGGACSACYSRSRIRSLRRQVEGLLGGKCRRCGFSDPRALQIDHIEGGGTQEKLRLTYDGLLRRVLRRPAEYQILCANCNWIKRSENSEHQLAQEVME